MKQLKGEVVQELPQPVMDLNVDAYVPDKYVDDSRQKVEIYKKVIAVKDLAGVDALAREVADGFGPIPEPVENLLQAAGSRSWPGMWGSPPHPGKGLSVAQVCAGTGPALGFDDFPGPQVPRAASFPKGTDSSAADQRQGSSRIRPPWASGRRSVRSKRCLGAGKRPVVEMNKSAKAGIYYISRCPIPDGLRARRGGR